MSAPLSGGISLRRAALSDVGSIRNLARSSYAKWVPLIGREPLPMGADYTRAVREHMIDLLFIGSELAGLIEMVNKGNHLLIENVAVAPPVQGKGHGRYLLAHAERVAASLGLVELKLYTNKLFERNIKFYSQVGYRIDHEVPFMEGVTVHMNKIIHI